MRVLFLTLSALAFLPAVFGGETNDRYSVQVVRNLLNIPQGISAGFQEKQMARLGDRTVVAALKIFSEEELKKPETIKRLLPVIRGSFANPELISDPEDKNAGVTLLLLKCLRSEVGEPELREQISGTIDFVKQHAQSPASNT